MATPPITPQRKRFSLWLGLAMLVTLLLGAIVGLYLTRTNQDIRQQAAGTNFSCGETGIKDGQPAGRIGATCVSACKPGSQVAGNCNKGYCCAPGGETTPTPTPKPPAPTPEDGKSYCTGTCIEGLSKEKGWCAELGRANANGVCNKGVCCSGGSSSGGGTGSGEGFIVGGNGAYCNSSGCNLEGKSNCVANRYHCDSNNNYGDGCQQAGTGRTTNGKLGFAAKCGMEQIDVACDGKNVDFVSKVYTSSCNTSITPTPKPPTPTPKPPTPTPTKPPGPQCLKLEMSGFPTNANDVIPGTTQVTFTCAANAALPAGYSYKFRVFEPCGSANHATPKELTSSGASATYTIPLRGSYAAQCAVCNGTGSGATCDWEAYTPTSCS